MRQESYPAQLAIHHGGRASGSLRPPSSKSLTQRYFALALLARRALRIEAPLISEDTELFLAGLQACGLRVDLRAPDANDQSLGAVEIAPGEPSRSGEIHCGNGGTMLRFLTAVLCALPGRWRLDGVPRLRERPVGPLLAALRSLGAEIHCEKEEGFVPLSIRGGSLRPGETELDAGESSQYLSALLMTGLALPGPLSVKVSSLTSTPYVDLTLAAMRQLGGKVERDGELFRVEAGDFASAEWPGVVEVEADLSAAAYPAALAALTGGRVRILGVSRGSLQGDLAFLDLLARMGASLTWDEDGVVVQGGKLRGIEADLAAMPDQVPTLAALAPFAAGRTVIRNVPHLRIKESDRLAAMASELGKLGARVEELPDGLILEGLWHAAEPPRAETKVETFGDHRIAMSLALVGQRRPGVIVDEPGVVRKSYPRFWQDLALLTGSSTRG